MIKSHIVSTGSYLPKKILTNHDLEKIVETSDEWIFQRSGIKQRHIAAENEATSDMAVEASKRALEQAGLSAEDIDGIIVATTTPDQTFPSVAVSVQAKLGVPVGVAFDVQAVCTGFIYALSVADNFIRAGQLKRVLVIGAEKMSAVIDWKDRTTCVLFGDGAGAVVLEARESGESEGVLSTHLYADGNMRDILYTDGGVSTTGQSGHIVMHGREVFKHAVGLMADAVNAALEHNNLSADQVDWLVPHQANSRIIESTAKKLSVPMEQVVMTVENHGNTSAASIPLAFDEAMRDGRIQSGQLVLFEALGGGLTWGSALVRIS
ncbi:MAG: beta-ketoacyl-ACP synthase III [Alphaproteobacteria bacterium]|nr:beta-ketoacyl-ACP synthase III [Alphaproteobacteria bacterium]